MEINKPASPAGDSRIILPHQQNAFDRLIEVAQVCFGTTRRTIPLALRSNSLIVGPSGCGKTFLAQAVANHFDAPFLAVSATDWVLIGCSNRGAINTWPAIAHFLHANRKKEGVVILIDEVHHAYGDGAWERFTRVELHSLFDLRLPCGLSANLDGEDADHPLSPKDLSEIEEVLANRTIIIGAGAFQELWEKNDATPIRFHQKEQAPELPTLKTLTRTLPTELINRFRSELLILPPLVLGDYKLMLETMAQKVPSYLRETFLRLGHARLSEVTRLRHGTRFLEELMLDTLLAERAALRNFRPPAPQSELNLSVSSPAAILDP